MCLANLQHDCDINPNVVCKQPCVELLTTHDHEINFVIHYTRLLLLAVLFNTDQLSLERYWLELSCGLV